MSSVQSISDKIKDILSEKCIKFNTHANRKRITSQLIELFESERITVNVPQTAQDNKDKFVSIRDSMTITHPNPNPSKDKRGITIMTEDESAKGDDFSKKYNNRG